MAWVICVETSRQLKKKIQDKEKLLLFKEKRIRLSDEDNLLSKKWNRIWEVDVEELQDACLMRGKENERESKNTLSLVCLVLLL